MDIQIIQLLNSFTGKSVYLDALFIFLAVYFPLVFAVGHFLFFKQIKKIGLWGWSLVVTALAFFSKELISLFYFRIRPFGSVEGINNLIGKSVEEAAFPSGHTLVAFTLAFSIFWAHKKWGIIFLVAALMIALSRIIVGVHYPTDILGGIFIAFMLSLIFRHKIIKL